ncbi:beta-ketoacyl-ACP synthase III [Yersinia enterocolitica]|uniref:Beta-ketoacyl-[acyl-carrier-protein] synthase III n=1 Tax=Yersinia enterocolitica serotype O:8 / biotype 1B (strain NCTC 13174 / 8081) TaxID=393305 RepID=FABH_YERE8|nr:beta-ketoacyl-ACP synthase III [Yersinia enterocolitica]A1JN67.1 RecName: Full=Beta-ketoacyl-[acyl-carrier-protein] synthase III; Short=Beta-ketoacyl-ACP synthase III; Short=KAS III; AltName: Full=3-oxoacyl-[acyl-carrier-protein] synthase 3; AltName: Full=3-oxoacyl-[acyl-carrier-protein] synthase III [Yersinia enterocolitica subsp. enterocolitica 8081]AJI81689.1 3-oxoacyl-[acyl-carrier-protein] synthase 3 [Yersinia enterocolitica]AJJ25455.1 3-oxoacyl-[acyl-carrier-] synthase III family protei
MYTKILGTGSYLPVQVRSNADLEKMVDTSDEWIVTRTGIRERRIAGPDETVASMGFQAAKKALEMAVIDEGIDKKDIGLIIVATTSSSHAFPSSACQVQQMLGIEDAASFDLAAACAGFTYALSVADQYVKSGAVKHAIVIGSDMLSRALDPEDRGTIILFGDGAGAVVLGASEEPGILSTHLHADGKYGELLALPYPDRQHQEQPAYVTMAGNEVFKVAVTELAHIVDETLQANNLDRSALDWLVPHQANLRIISATAKKLGMGMDKVVITLDRHGNTSAASVPAAFDEAVRDGRIQRGQLVLLEAFGGGFTWGSALVRF